MTRNFLAFSLIFIELLSIVVNISIFLTIYQVFLWFFVQISILNGCLILSSTLKEGAYAPSIHQDDIAKLCHLTLFLSFIHRHIFYMWCNTLICWTNYLTLIYQLFYSMCTPSCYSRHSEYWRIQFWR